MTMMGTWTISIMLLSVSSVQHEEPETLLTRGRLDADLGDFGSAARLFETVADDPEAAAELRLEAFVRLGQVKEHLGQHEESVAAFERVFEDFSNDPDAIRFLTLAVTGVVPSSPRWESLWQDITLDVVHAPHPSPVIRWPGFDSSQKRRYDGKLVSLRAEDASAYDVARELSGEGDFSFVMYAEGESRVTVSIENTPWDRVLDLVASAADLAVERDDDVLILGDAASFDRLRTARRLETSGERMTIDFRDQSLDELFRLFADVTGLNVVVLPGIQGRVSLSLREMAWERALFYVLDSQGLAATRRDQVLVIAEPERLEPFIEMETKAYRGDVVSIDFAGSDFDEVMSYFSERTGHPVVAADRFSGSLHFKLTDVPWDQALDLIANLYGLRFELRDGAIRIDR